MAGFWAHGTTVSVDSTLVKGLTSISFPERTRGEVPVTDHDSAGTTEFKPGLRDGGNITLEGRYLPEDTGQLALESNYEADDGSLMEVVITLPDRATSDSDVTTVTCNAFVTSLTVDLPGDSDDPATFSCTLRVSGLPSVATA